MANEQNISAGETIAIELMGITKAGAMFVPTAIEPEPSNETSPTVYTDAKVIAFLRGSPESTAMEISGGTTFPKSIVKAALGRSIAAGTVIIVGGAENTCRYRLAVSVPVQPAATAEPYISDAQRWDMEQRKRVADEAAMHRAPDQRRWEPSDAEIDAELSKQTTIVLTSEQVKDLEMRTRDRRQGFNPQSAIKR